MACPRDYFFPEMITKWSGMIFSDYFGLKQGDTVQPIQYVQNRMESQSKHDPPPQEKGVTYSNYDSFMIWHGVTMLSRFVGMLCMIVVYDSDSN